MKFKKPPVKEVQSAKKWSYDPALFDTNSPYFEALRSSESLIRKKRPDLPFEQWKQFRTLLVHECEMAKAWRELWESKDDPQRAMAEWFNTAQDSLSSLNGFLQSLRKMDARQGYLLRGAFYSSARVALSPEQESTAVMPDPNLAEGGFEVPTGGRVAQAVESQLLARLFQGRFEQWLDELEKEFSRPHVFRIGRRIGPMFLEPPIEDGSMSKRDSTSLAILALVGRLRKAFTLALRAPQTSMPHYQMLGGEMPARPAAAWNVIHQLIQAAFLHEAADLDLLALKQRWSAATNGRSIYFSSWPEPVERQGSD